MKRGHMEVFSPKVTLHFQDIPYNHGLEFVVDFNKYWIKLQNMLFFTLTLILFSLSVTLDCLLVVFHYSC